MPIEKQNTEGRRSREVAKRIFTSEIERSSLEFKDGSDQYAPTYHITPTGAKVNRAYMVGVLTEKTEDKETGQYRARLADPTGAIYMYVGGKYQPEAGRLIKDISLLSIVAVVGKLSSYKMDTGETRMSIKPEYIRVTDEAEKAIWTAEACKSLLDRLKTLKTGPTPEQAKALEHYKLGATDIINSYKPMAIDALMGLKKTTAELSATTMKKETAKV